MLDRDRVASIVEKNPRIDGPTIERSREIAKRLAEIGIESGTYRLEPALGGEILKKAQMASRVRHQEGGSRPLAGPRSSQDDDRGSNG